MYGYIYKTTCLKNNMIYIGQCKSNKFLGKKYLGSSTILKPHIKKYGKEAFDIELLQECETFEELNEAEKYWIKEFDSRNPEIGWNITLGGQGTCGVDPGYHDGMLGKHQSDYQKECARKACSYKRSPEQCKAMSIGQTGKKYQPWINNGIVSKRPKMSEDLNIYIANGWVYGRLPWKNKAKFRYTEMYI